MKKFVILMLSSAFLFGSCDTYTGSGAYVGGSLGSILGSAIGGLSGGPRGSDMGTIIGMAGGAVLGGVIGSEADQRQQAAAGQARRERRERIYNQAQQPYDEVYGGQPSTYGNGTSNNYGSNGTSNYGSNGASSNDDTVNFDSTNSGDDRLYDFSGKDYTGDYSAQKPTQKYPSSTVDELGANFEYSPNLVIVNARFVDDNEDSRLNRNETAKLIFEVMNRGKQPVFDVVPTVVETTGNKHIFISPNIHIERIDPGKGIRYTAMIKADSRLKDGVARFCVSVIHGDKAISKVNEFNIPTSK